MKAKTLLKLTSLLAIVCAITVGMVACTSGGSSAKTDTGKTVTALMAGAVKPELADTTDTNACEIKFYELVYDPLVRYGENGKIEPALAESYSISDDGKVYTFKLRKGVKFSNGEDFNADNVLFNAKRWSDKARSNFSAKLLDVKKIDDYTVSFTFEKAAYPIIIEFTYPRPFRMLAKAAVDENGKFKAPIGTGQWMVKDFKSGVEAKLVPNPHYWAKKPDFDTLVIKQVKDGQARTMALQSKEADLSLADIPAEDIQKVKEDKNLAMLTDESTQSFFLGINYDNEILKDQKVRQALNYATNKQLMVKDLLNGNGVPAKGVFSNKVPYITEKNSVGYAYNIKKAKALLKEAGYTSLNKDGILEKDGKPLTLKLVLQTQEYANWKSICQFLQSEYKKIGINVVLEEREMNAYYDAIWKNRNYDLIIYRSYEDSWNPHGFLKSVFCKKEKAAGVFWNDDTLSAMITDVLGTYKENERNAKYDKIMLYMNEKAITVPLYYPNRQITYNKRLGDLKLAPTIYQGVDWNSISIKK